MRLLDDSWVLRTLETAGQVPCLKWLPIYQRDDGSFQHVFTCPAPSCSKRIVVCSEPNNFLELAQALTKHCNPFEKDCCEWVRYKLKMADGSITGDGAPWTLKVLVEDVYVGAYIAFYIFQQRPDKTYAMGRGVMKTWCGDPAGEVQQNVPLSCHCERSS